MISIIIPTYNEEKTIEKTLESIEMQYTTCEVIIVDAGTDNLAHIVTRCKKHYSFEIIYKRALTRGRAAQMNEGAHYASGDILLFLHADTFLPNNALVNLNKAFTQSIIGGAFSLSFQKQNLFYRLVACYSNHRARFFRIYHGDQAQFIDKKVFEKIGGFVFVPLMEDVIFSKAMKQYGKTILLKQKVQTSERRIEQYGKIKSILRYFYIKFLFKVGVSLDIIASLYKK